MKSVLEFQKMKAAGSKISMVTCYDFTSARILEATNVDCLLVGDSLAMTMHGNDTTLSATPELMALHTQAVRRGAPTKFIVADMPFLAHRGSLDRTLEAVRIIMNAGANAVKIEGVEGSEEVLKHLVQGGVPVMSHLGLTPQSVHQLGGYKVQATTSHAANLLVKHAKQAEEAGAFALVLECVPSSIASKITAELEIPTIGIGAGQDCDGQVLVMQDLLGLNREFKPKFVRRFMDGFEVFRQAFDQFDRDVKSSEFPNASESYLMSPDAAPVTKSPRIPEARS